MNFSDALAALKNGSTLAREGWNAKNQYIYLVPAGRYKVSTPTGAAIAEKQDDNLVPYQAYVAIKTVQGTVVPWFVFQSDLLAKDWIEYTLGDPVEGFEEEEAPEPATDAE